MVDKQIKNFSELSSPIQERDVGNIERLVSYLGTKRFFVKALIFISIYISYNLYMGKKGFDQNLVWLSISISIFTLFTYTFVGILEKIHTDLEKRTTDLYHAYEYEINNNLNSKINELTDKVDKIIELIKESKI